MPALRPIAFHCSRYNHENYLVQRIESVLNQTYQDFEVIVLDDCSSDNSRDIIDRYREHPKVSHIVFNTQNSGSTFKQWKKGVELAKGEWIWIAESDDYCDADLLNTLFANTLSCANTVLSYCQSYEVDEEGTVCRDMTFHTDALSIEQWNVDYCGSGMEEIKNYLLYRNTIPNASAVLFRKKAYEKVSNAFENMKMCGDWMLWLQLLKQGNIAYCSKPLNSFRKHQATTRVLDTLTKRKLRMEEEYQIALDVKRTIGPDYRLKVQERIKNIVREYISYLRGGERIKFFAHPLFYNNIIPFISLLAAYIRRRVYKVDLQH